MGSSSSKSTSETEYVVVRDRNGFLVQVPKSSIQRPEYQPRPPPPMYPPTVPYGPPFPGHGSFAQVPPPMLMPQPPGLQGPRAPPGFVFNSLPVAPQSINTFQPFMPAVPQSSIQPPNTQQRPPPPMCPPTVPYGLPFPGHGSFAHAPPPMLMPQPPGLPGPHEPAGFVFNSPPVAPQSITAFQPFTPAAAVHPLMPAAPSYSYAPFAALPPGQYFVHAPSQMQMSFTSSFNYPTPASSWMPHTNSHILPIATASSFQTGGLFPTSPFIQSSAMPGWNTFNAAPSATEFVPMPNGPSFPFFSPSAGVAFSPATPYAPPVPMESTSTEFTGPSMQRSTPEVAGFPAPASESWGQLPQPQTLFYDTWNPSFDANNGFLQPFGPNQPPGNSAPPFALAPAPASTPMPVDNVPASQFSMPTFWPPPSDTISHPPIPAMAQSHGVAGSQTVF